MERMLFHPFRFEFWLVLGFAAFLSEFLSGGVGSQYTWHGRGGGVPREIARRVRDLFQDPAVSAFVVVSCVLALILVVALQWVSARGKFVFLDDVVHGRSAIVEPWKRFAREGDSLFIWMLLFWLACLLAAALVALPFLAVLRSVWMGGEFRWTGVASLFGLLFMSIPVVIAAAYTVLFLNHFIVPIMYRHRLTTTEAWRRFLPLLRAQPAGFIVYGLLMILLWIAVAAAVMIVGVSTCCVGLLVFTLPYVGEVVLLPVLVTFRAFGPEFLAQLGPDHDVFAATAEIPQSPGASA